MAVRHNWRGHSVQKCCLRITIRKFNDDAKPRLEELILILQKVQLRKEGLWVRTSDVSLVCGCIDDLKTSDSDDPNSPEGQASRQEMSEMLNRHVRRQEERLAKQEERLASTRRVQSNIEALNRDVTAFKRLDKSPPPYVTPPSSSIAQSEMPPSMPRLLPIRKPEFEGSSYVSDSAVRTSGRAVYPQAPLAESPVPQPGYTLDGPP